MASSPNMASMPLPLLSRLDARGCVVCDSSSQLECPPSCEKGFSCQFSTTTCTRCATSYCAKDDDATSSPSTNKAEESGDKPNVGAIAGGVVGGVVVIAIITYLVWRYCIKTKRQPVAQRSWDEEQERAPRSEKDFAAARSQRASTHTVHSIASTVLTRASNIIQIAYIPGVTNRATPNSPGLLVPPVPPIPLSASSAQSSPSAYDGEQRFFVPGDLRDSTYSGMSGYTDRTSYARTSYAARSSIASTIYGKNAVVTPAQMGMRAKPAMVSVKSNHSSSSNEGAAPPVPAIDYEKYTVRPPSPANSTFSVGSTFLNSANAHTAMPVRAQVVRVGSSPKKPSSPLVEMEGSPVPEPSANVPAHGDDNLLIPNQGPFSDAAEQSSQRSNKSLSAVIDEATRRASSRDGKTLTGREPSPFSDAYATRD